MRLSLFLLLSFTLSASAQYQFKGTAGSAKARPGSTGGKVKNLVYNGGFEHPEEPTKGWTLDYQWQGNTHYMKNHTRVSLLETYKGHKNVLFINGNGETKVECKPIPFKYEEGIKYRCSLDLNTNTGPHIYFTGYKWNPGIRPHEDPHLGDLRRIYKSQFRNHKSQNLGNGWKRVTFEFPIENPSKMAIKHLKYLRFITVHVMVIADAPGQAYIDNINVTRIK